jgi:hypothetical protein
MRIAHTDIPSGSFYAIILDGENQQIWNNSTSQFETFNPSSGFAVENFAIALTEASLWEGFYFVDIASFDADEYAVLIYEQQGVSPDMATDAEHLRAVQSVDSSSTTTINNSGGADLSGDLAAKLEDLERYVLNLNQHRGTRKR